MAIRLFYLQRKGSSVFSWPHFESLFVKQLQVIWGSRPPPSCQILEIQSTDSTVIVPTVQEGILPTCRRKSYVTDFRHYLEGIS
jgi:hypothetical protein